MQRGRASPTAQESQTLSHHPTARGYLKSSKRHIWSRMMVHGRSMQSRAWGRVLGLHLCAIPKTKAWLWSSSLPRL